MKFNIRLLYLYLFSFVGLLVTVIGTIRLVDLGLKVYVFKNADVYTYMARPLAPEGKPFPAEEEARMRKEQDQENKRQRQRTAAEALAMIVVGGPLYLYHWRTITRESKKKK